MNNDLANHNKVEGFGAQQYCNLYAYRIINHLYIVIGNVYYNFASANTEYKLNKYLDLSTVNTINIYHGNLLAPLLDENGRYILEGPTVRIQLKNENKKVYMYAASSRAGVYNSSLEIIGLLNLIM